MPKPGEQHLKSVIARLRAGAPPPPDGLPAALCDRLELALLACAPADVAPLFLDDRIAPWRDLIPETAAPIDRARAIIDALFHRADHRHTNALILFLDVLHERSSPRDACHRRLYLLRCELQGLIDER
jgi:hypothetical protein